MEPSDRCRRSCRRDLAAAAAVTVLAAGWLSWQTLRLPPAVTQFSKYPVAAVAALHGGGDPERMLDFSPAYLALHRAAWAALDEPVTGILVIQVLCTALAAGMLLLLIREFAPLPFAIVGAGAFALDRSIAVYTYVFEPEPLVLLGLMACLLLATRRGVPAAGGGGVALALAVLSRPSFLPLAVLVPLAWLAQREGRRRLAVRTGAFLLPVAAAVVALAVRNHAITGSHSPIVMNPGTVFYDGNNPLAAGHGVAYPPVVNELAVAEAGESDYQHAVYRRLARLEAGRQLSVSEVNSLWLGKALAFARENPGAFLSRAVRKALWILHAYRWHDLRPAWLADRELEARGTPAIPLALVAALAVLGLALARPLRDGLLPAYGAVLIQSAVMVATYTSARQRLALVPLLCLFAVVGADRLWSVCRGQRGRRPAIAAVVGVVALAILLGRQSDLMRDREVVWEGLELSGRLAAAAAGALERGDRPAAVRAAAEAIVHSPWAAAHLVPDGLAAETPKIARTALDRFPGLRGDDPSARLDRAILLQMAGRLDPAAAQLRGLVEKGTRFERLPERVGEPRYHLARVAMLQGRRDEAALLAREALNSSPGDPSALALLAALTGDRDPIERLGRYFDVFDARLFLGRAFLAAGKPAEAVAQFESLTRALPELEDAWKLLDVARAEQRAGANITLDKLVVWRKDSQKERTYP